VLLEQEVAFRVDYNVPAISRDFGTVFLGNQNVAMLVVSGGWAKVGLNTLCLCLHVYVVFELYLHC
jgi:hypothetical protein